MPSRKGIVRVDAEKVMGEESYVKVRRLTYGEMKEITQAGQEKATEVRKRLEEPDLTPELRDAYLAEIDANETRRLMELTVRRYVDHILDWNWVDENDDPLPLPKDDPSVIDKLYNSEITFLSEALFGQGQDEKN